MKSIKPHTSITPLFISIFFLVKHSLCIDPLYQSCVPKDCGDGINITYPFFINDLHNSACGYPGFNVTCINGSTVLRISGNNFTVQRIDTGKRSIRLQYASISSNRTQSCLSDIVSLFIDPSRYTIDTATTKRVVLVRNCSVRVPAELDEYRIRSCENRTEFVVAESDRNWSNVTEGCGGETVRMRVELGDGERLDGRNYEEVVGRGFTMRWRAADCGVCERSGGRCGFNTSVYQFVCLCTDRPHKVRCKSENSHRTLIIISVTVGFALLVTLGSGIFGLYRAYKRRVFTYISSKDKSREVEDDSVYGVPVFSYAELQDATEHFDPSKELGDGGFGTVYYGKLRDGREVAVKRLYEHNYKRVQQFMNEVEILTKLRHRNLVSLYGCTSRRSRELLLVYEFISNGTVADHLHGDLAKQNPLTWQTRLKIAIETANALVYLHACDIIHRDVKTNNILLDSNYCVKVADFGLSRLLPNDVTHVSTAPQGTPGYVDPEYHRLYQLTDKSDVYSFGVVLIELISSMPAIDISRSREEISLANMAVNMIQRRALDELVDPFLASNPDAEKMTSSVAELAFRCLQIDSETRPSMNEVLEALMDIRVEESGDVIVGDVTDIKPVLPPLSPETEGAGLIKGRIAASPTSVTAKWFSTSSGSVTSNASVSN